MTILRRKWRQSHPKRVAAYALKRRQANPGKEATYNHEYYLANREKILARKKRLRQAARQKLFVVPENGILSFMTLDQIGTKKIHIATRYYGSGMWHWLIDDWFTFAKQKNLGDFETVQVRDGKDWKLMAWRVRG